MNEQETGECCPKGWFNDACVLGVLVALVMAGAVVALFARVGDLKRDITTLRAYNEEVWRTFVEDHERMDAMAAEISRLGSRTNDAAVEESP